MPTSFRTTVPEEVLNSFAWGGLVGTSLQIRISNGDRSAIGTKRCTGHCAGSDLDLPFQP